MRSMWELTTTCCIYVCIIACPYNIKREQIPKENGGNWEERKAKKRRHKERELNEYGKRNKESAHYGYRTNIRRQQTLLNFGMAIISTCSYQGRSS